jgi:hypothetical protein
VPAVPFAAACCSWMLAGCTFLIDFEDVPVADAGLDAPTNVPPDVRVDAPALPDGASDADAPIDSPADARDGNPGFVTACNGKADGKYCPGNQITWPGDKDELVTCRGGKVFATKRCTTGTGCIFMLAGYPDECDQCATKATGTYCGRDMPGWDTKNTNFRVRCQSGAQVGLLLCNGTCNSNGGASTCP